MLDTDIVVYGADWCGDCRRAKRFFTQHNIPFRWIDIDRDQTAETFVIRTNHGNRSIPTIVFADGSILVEPSTETLARKFGVTLAFA